MNIIIKSLGLSIFLLCLWEIIVWGMVLPDYILPSPYQVGSMFYQSWWLILMHAVPTLSEILLGFFFGVICGCLFGLILAYFTRLADWCLPLLIISQAIPTFAMAPLLVIWFGYGLLSKLIIIILMIFFPVASTFYDGLRRTPDEWLELAHTMHASRWRTFFTIRIPAALPSLASGMRMAAVFAPIGGLIGEWVGASQGLGYLMINANAHMQIDLMFATLLIIILLSLCLYFSVDKLLRTFIWW